MYEYIFYYWYILLGHTKRGKSIIDASAFTWLAQFLHILSIIGFVKLFCKIDIVALFPQWYHNKILNAPYADGRIIFIVSNIPYLILIALYCHKRLPKLKEQFKDKTDQQILCWKNTTFVVCVTLFPLIFIMWIAGAFD